MSRAAVAERALVLPGAPRSAGHARRFLDGLLADSGVADDVVDTATLLLSELVTNAVLHAGTSMTVRATVTAPAPFSTTPGAGDRGGRPRPDPHRHGLDADQMLPVVFRLSGTPLSGTPPSGTLPSGTPARHAARPGEPM